jgi:ribosome-binding protein aMBF1 (putative translation factor)
VASRSATPYGLRSTRRHRTNQSEKINHTHQPTRSGATPSRRAGAAASRRSQHRLSQTALADRLGMSQPAVARLESGEHNPTFPTLLRISDALGIEFAIDIAPSGHEPQLVGSHARRNALESFQGNGCAVVIAAT